MKDKLRELAERWSAKDPVCEAGVITITMDQCAAELLAILDAEGDGGAVPDDDLPGMWSNADFTGGDPDELGVGGQLYFGTYSGMDGIDYAIDTAMKGETP